MFTYRPSSNIIVVTGHYGVGKTNVAVNLALDLKKRYRKVTLIDIDIVNPFFRSADNEELLKENGIRCIFPAYAKSNVDIPALSPEIYSVFEDDGITVFDVGGDDRGSTVLASFSDRFAKSGYEMLYVVNKYRPMIEDPHDAVALLREIEMQSTLTATHLINNSNLGAETDRSIILSALPYANAVSELAGLPLLCTTAADESLDGDVPNLFPIKNITKCLY